MVSQSVVIGDVVFVNSLIGNYLIHQYSANDNEWSTLPRPMVVAFGLGQLSGKLITVGGGDKGQSVGNVYQFNEESQQWEDSPIPPMPTPRQRSCVITHQSNVAACGGLINKEASAAVEVFMSSTSQWHRAAPLPIPCAVTQCTVTQDTCYLGRMLTADLKSVLHSLSSSKLCLVTSNPQLCTLGLAFLICHTLEVHWLTWEALSLLLVGQKLSQYFHLGLTFSVLFKIQ